MKIDCNMPVQEPRSSKLLFISKLCLKEHVVKHIIKAPEERWGDLFSPELIIGVREEYWENESIYKLKDFKLLTTLYARLAAKTLSNCCSEGKDHVHQVEEIYTVKSDAIKCLKRFQKIQAYSEEKRIVVIAALQANQNQSSQTNNTQQKEGKAEPQDYVILTMYRPEKKLLKKQSFKSWFNDRIERGNPKHPNEALLADHR